MNNIKWCAIQPLTGGMYLGAEKAIGHPAEFILTYPGNGDPRGNEYNLMMYLDKVGRRPEYKILNRKPFQDDEDMNPEILNHERWTINPDKELDYSNIDVCVAVPVCSGLSNATIGSQESKNTRNCNMLWIAKYALSVIKPKIYIFENAPTFMGKRGDYIREEIEAVALRLGYSIDYYKTDTMLHDNCQTRKRTFIIFYKKEYAPKMGYEKILTDYDEYFGRIPKEATQQEELDFEDINEINYFCVEWAKDKFGENWREAINYDVFRYIWKFNLFDDLDNFVQTSDLGTPKHREFLSKFLKHFQYKISIGGGVYHALPNVIHDHKPIPAVMFKMVQSVIHPHEDRSLNIRELLHLMGHPHDFELQGDTMKEYGKIGQNVPARTAYWIVSESLRAYNDNTETSKRVRYFNNMKQKEEPYLFNE
ncbi:MAG: DNA cytosine methyltransferase [Clostridia bacterium]|nr:DNA cytosine methyltransferase [Clostridia bacterium]